MADQFSQIQQELAINDISQWQDAFQRLRTMLQVLDCFEGTQSHRLVDNQEHVRRIIDLILGSTCFEAFDFVLRLEENPMDSTNADIKIEALKCLSYLTIAAKYLSSAQGLQSNYLHQHSSLAPSYSIS